MRRILRFPVQRVLVLALVVRHLPVEALMLAPMMIRKEVSVAVAAVLDQVSSFRSHRLILRLHHDRLWVVAVAALVLTWAGPFLQRIR